MPAEQSVHLVFVVCLVYAATHSLLVSRRAKVFFSKVIGEEFVRSYYRLIFVVFSAIAMFAAFFIIMSLPDTYIFRAPAWLKWPLHLAQIGAMLFGMMSLLVLNFSEFFGLQQVRRRGRLDKPDMAGLTIDGLTETAILDTGVYSIVRHPIYFAGIVMISFQPEITYNRLVVTVLADLYFIYAAVKEERLLLASSEERYGAYMKEVPMFNIFKGVYNKLYR